MAELARELAREGGCEGGGEGVASLFGDLVGQPRAVGLLEAALRQRRVAPAYLFAGPEGVGRRLAALRFLEGLVVGEGVEGDAAVRRRLAQGNHPDLLWVEPTYSHQGKLVPASQAEAEGVNRRTPPQLRLEQIRDVSRFLSRRSVEARGAMVVLEAAEAMAEAAANALLKTLEEPGDGLLILISAAPDRLLSTIRSRCQQIPFRRLEPRQLRQVLERQGAGPIDGAGGKGAAGEGGVAGDGGGRDRAAGAGAARDGDSAGDGGAAGDGAAGKSGATGDGLARDDDPPELLELAAGSPGALLEHRRQWRGLPEGLAERLGALPSDPLSALALARDLSEALDGDQQLWLLNWLQLSRWRRQPRPAELERLEQLRRQLRSHVQPRLAWEVALLELAGLKAQ
jgi:DNA polymerase-3 subunit delta'